MRKAVLFDEFAYTCPYAYSYEDERINNYYNCKHPKQREMETPKNKKPIIILSEYKSESTNCDRAFIEINHNKKGERYACITHEIQMKNNRTRSHSVYINYCPFCGQNLLNQIIKED